jgi:hypothetical protein
LALEGPEQLQRAQTMLMELIQEHSIHWVEPTNRLATLYYLQGHLKAAEALCLVVLAIKPWHFGALNGLVLVYTGLNEYDKVAEWSSRRLLGSIRNDVNRSRKVWVQQAVQRAEDNLSNANTILSKAFGQSDDHYTEQLPSLAASSHTNDDEDSWQ